MIKNLPKKGRYYGDYATTVTYNPLKDYAYIVKVYQWRTSSWEDDGVQWLEILRFGDPWRTKDFKTLERAMKYRAKVLLDADTNAFRKKRNKKINESTQVLG